MIYLLRKLFVIVISSCFLFLAIAANAAAPKEWTFLIFKNNNNDLDEFGKGYIKSMEKVGSNDQVNVVVQWASLKAGKAVRMLIQKSANPKEITSPIIQDLGQVDMGDYHVLDDFIQWGVKNYPAQHYFIAIADHGTGFALSFDDNTNHKITAEQLGLAMEHAAQIIGHKVDIYGSEACLMGLAEVASEMTDSVSIYIGSEDRLTNSWFYTDLLSQWEAISHASAEQVATTVVSTYVEGLRKQYEPYGGLTDISVTLSAIDLSKFSALEHAFGNVSANIRSLNSSDKAKVLNIAKTVQPFGVIGGDGGYNYADLLDFMNKLSTANIPSLNPNYISDVQTAVNQLVISNKAGPDYTSATGVAIWLPTDLSTGFQYKYSAYYQGLKFNINTKWGNTLDYLLH